MLYNAAVGAEEKISVAEAMEKCLLGRCSIPLPPFSVSFNPFMTTFYIVRHDFSLVILQCFNFQFLENLCLIS